MLSTTEINTLPFRIVRALCDAWACRNNNDEANEAYARLMLASFNAGEES